MRKNLQIIIFVDILSTISIIFTDYEKERVRIV